MLDLLTHKDEAGNDLSNGSFKDGNGEWVWQEKGQRPIALTYKNGKIVKRKRLKE
ncbi:MAG: hypothetical protein Q7T20_16955 [Saprospiraceae bacterium]|nr:hypothetical protein [Saprospiraceae bacterium]